MSAGDRVLSILGLVLVFVAMATLHPPTLALGLGVLLLWAADGGRR